jgi:hypothetical protein
LKFDPKESLGIAVHRCRVCADGTRPADALEVEVIGERRDNRIGVDVYIEDSAPMFFGAWSIVAGTGNYADLRGGGANDSDGDEYDPSIGRLWTATNNN